ncbi:MAG TPA: glycosyltransferase family 2 protein, partial [Woeseiaceae bacterium]
FVINPPVRDKEPRASRISPKALPIKQLSDAAADLASSHQLLSPRAKGQRLRQRLNETAQSYERVREELTDAVRRTPAESDVVDWLLDNTHVVRSHRADIRRNLPAKYYRFLPTVKTEHELVLRVYALAQELVANTNGRLTVEAMTQFLEAYQEKAPLFIAELWVFPLMVRLVLVELVTELSQQVLRRHRLMEEADFLANRQLAAARTEGEDASRIFAFIARRHSKLEPRFITRLGEHLSDDAVSRPLLEKWVEERFQTTLSAIVGQDHAAESAARVSVSNAIGSLRVLSEVDFKQIFERVSRVEQILREDPSGIYARSDFATRDRCRRAIELTARHSTRSESDTAREVLEAAREGEASPHNRKQHVGYYLLDEGLREIERRVGCRPRWRERLRRWAYAHPTTVYLTGIAALITALLTGCAWLAYAGGLTSPWLLAAVTLMAVFPAGELALHVINSLVILLLGPRRLPQMDYLNGIPDDCRTLVVVPMMLVSADIIRRQAERLEVHFLSNKDANLSFALLSDFTDAESPVTDEDEPLLAAAKEAIETLNQRYGNGRFLLLHRSRQWCETEQKWIGWERKRGKLEELNRFLTGAIDAPGPEFVAAGSAPAGIRYVITLDSDTQLPAAAARGLVETISHPLNRIELTEDGRHRRRGYGIVQPRLSVTLPGAMATRFTRLFTDTTGTDPYCQAVSDVYQDLFAEANYHGKAIYDVSAFHAILDKRFPEQTLLSHDLIEGGHVGVGLASHIEVFENFPETYDSYLKREHRWTRGDWQIADWVTPSVPAPGGGRTSNPLSTINRRKILDNLRRSLTAPLSAALLLTCWFASAAPGVYSLLVGLAMLTPTLSSLAQRFDMLESVRPNFRRLVRKDLARAFADIALLPHRAYVLADAIVRVWYRRLISRRNLLEWQPADAADRQSASMLSGTFVQMFIVSAASCVILAYLLMAGRSQIAAPFLALWIASPLIIQWLAQERRDPKSGELSASDRNELRRIARRTWRFFDDLVSPQSNWLPPDNLQEKLRLEVARRTSPTNIGLWFTAALSAQDFGYLTFDELIERLQSTCATLAKLERYEGHFLNWYDIDLLQPIEPRYVSSVDSGNCVASCWLLVEGLREIARSPLLTAACLTGLRDTLAIVRQEVTQLGAGATAVRSLGIFLDMESRRAYEIAENLRLAQVPMAKLGAAMQWTHSEEPSGEAAYWITRLQKQIEAHVELADTYLAWMTVIEAPPDAFLLPLGKDAPELREIALTTAPSLEDLAHGRVPGLTELLERRAELTQLPAGLAEWLGQIEQEIAVASARAAQTLGRIDALAASIARFADETNFRFLYDD